MNDEMVFIKKSDSLITNNLNQLFLDTEYTEYRYCVDDGGVKQIIDIMAYILYNIQK